MAYGKKTTMKSKKMKGGGKMMKSGGKMGGKKKTTTTTTSKRKTKPSAKAKAMNRGFAATVRQGAGPAGGKGTRSLGGTKSETVTKKFTKKKLNRRKPRA